MSTSDRIGYTLCPDCGRRVLIVEEKLHDPESHAVIGVQMRALDTESRCWIVLGGIGDTHLYAVRSGAYVEHLHPENKEVSDGT